MKVVVGRVLGQEPRFMGFFTAHCKPLISPVPFLSLFPCLERKMTFHPDDLRTHSPSFPMSARKRI
jgi:hypothetical protein